MCNSLCTQILLPLHSQNLSYTISFQICLVLILIAHFTIGHLLFVHTSFSTSAVYSELVLAYASHYHCAVWFFLHMISYYKSQIRSTYLPVDLLL